MSTTDYLDTLTIDQLRFARDEADKRIKAAELKPKKIVWVVSDHCINLKWFREEDFQSAFDFYVSAVQKEGVRYMKEFIEERPGTRYYEQIELKPIYENGVEYEEWFK